MILDRGGASGLSHRPASISGARVSETISLQRLRARGARATLVFS
jgi:hypothetical protein